MTAKADINDKYDLLISAFNPEIPDTPRSIMAGICAMTGERLSGNGYKLADIIGPETTGQAEMFRFGSQLISERAARLIRASRLLRGNLLALPELGLRPMISMSTATEERPCWRDLINSLEIGTPTVAIISSEFQRRLWHLATLSHFGSSWRPFVNFDNECRTLTIDVSKLRECLDLVEEVYAVGFSKVAIKNGLIDGSAIKIIKLIGYGQTKEYEERLKAWRNCDEFKLAVFIAQKEEKEDVRRTESSLAEVEAINASLAS